MSTLFTHFFPNQCTIQCYMVWATFCIIKWGINKYHMMIPCCCCSSSRHNSNDNQFFFQVDMCGVLLNESSRHCQAAGPVGPHRTYKWTGKTFWNSVLRGTFQRFTGMQVSYYLLSQLGACGCPYVWGRVNPMVKINHKSCSETTRNAERSVCM